MTFIDVTDIILHIDKNRFVKILCDSGLVNSRRNGKWMYYSLSKDACEATKKYSMKLQ
ncbi:hypothetical protein SBF1_5900004 [Candidatus Desulfosporosinus infrequens]|uniref:HTH arsR-type domain-containing protein n=1 Tax=Candidatus Desulfosporosinus infrequens TaxID=2043169 RepID=A0A2U3LL81_9FIRM|nr:hypothetical protein SBF1_5900004 [Candidatus Desulfosporosinus infrequens]